MLDSLSDLLASYTTEDFENIAAGLGTLALGVGTVLVGVAGLKTIPRALREKHKDEGLIKLYQRVVYRMYKEVTSSSEGIAYSLPKDRDQIADLMIRRFPQIGDRDTVRRLMDDLMLDDYFKYVHGNTTVMKTVKWDPEDPSKAVDPIVEDLPRND